jgi:hypothetical protein
MTRLAALSLLLAQLSPALAGTPTHCLTDEEKTLGGWQTLCDDGTRAGRYLQPHARLRT